MIGLKAATQGIEERGSLSPSLSIRNAVKFFESTRFGIPLFLSFNFDGRLAAKDGDECVKFATYEWCAALGAKLLSIRNIFTRVWCLASGAKTRVAGTVIYDFRHRFNDYGASLAHHRSDRNSGSGLYDM